MTMPPGIKNHLVLYLMGKPSLEQKQKHLEQKHLLEACPLTSHALFTAVNALAMNTKPALT